MVSSRSYLNDGNWHMVRLGGTFFRPGLENPQSLQHELLCEKDNFVN